MMGAAHTLHALALLVVVGAAHCSALALVPSAVATCRTWQVTNADTHNGTYNMAFSEDGTHPCVITLCELVVAAHQLCVLMGEVWVGVQVPRWSLPPRIALCRPMTHALEVFCGQLRAPLMCALSSTRVARLWLPVRASCMPCRVRTSPASCWRSQQRLLVARRARCL